MLIYTLSRLIYKNKITEFLQYTYMSWVHLLTEGIDQMTIEYLEYQPADGYEAPGKSRQWVVLD